MKCTSYIAVDVGINYCTMVLWNVGSSPGDRRSSAIALIHDADSDFGSPAVHIRFANRVILADNSGFVSALLAMDIYPLTHNERTIKTGRRQE